MKFKIGKNILSNESKTYFIADIGANHDGSLKRAKKLIKLCAKAGANAAKFQHFKARTIVSDFGFKSIGKIGHTKKWKKSVFKVFEESSINNSWTPVLKSECKKNNIDFLTSPYDLDYVKSVNKYVEAYKIGSGDISWHDIIDEIAKKNKPIFLACGASEIEHIVAAIKRIQKVHSKIALMQCNSNYTNSDDNYKHINLNVLKSFRKKFGNKIILGLSDHTKGHNSVLGAVALGARCIEKHFTDDNSRKGPDHKFAMNPRTWSNMVNETSKLEASLGDGLKTIQQNEKLSCIVQRRSIRAKDELEKGKIIKSSDLVFLRPAPKNSFLPMYKKKVIGKKLRRKILKEQNILKKDLI